MQRDQTFELLIEKMSTKSDTELSAYLIDPKKYGVLEFSAAAYEIKQRKLVDEAEWQNILAEISLKLFGKNPKIPFYYSRGAVFRVSFFFSVVFGAILLAMNLKNREEKNIVIGFGLTYLVLQITLATIIPFNVLLIFGFHLTGCAILHTFFWNKYIGKGFYLKKTLNLEIVFVITIMLVLYQIIHFFWGHCDLNGASCIGHSLAIVIKFFIY